MSSGTRASQTADLTSLVLRQAKAAGG